jgi:hypothetical protein
MGGDVNGLGPFARLARTHALLTSADALVAMALAGSLFFSISPGAARSRVALSLVLTMAPFAVVAPLLGPAIDRSKSGRRVVVVVTSVGRAMAAIVMVEVIDGLLLFPAAFTTLVLAKSYSVAKSALVPDAVRSEDDLVEGNAKLAMVSALAGVLAAVPGLLLLRFAGPQWVLRLSAFVFLAGAAAALSLEERRHGSPLEVELEREELRNVGIVHAAVVMSVLRASVGFLTFLVAFELRRPPEAPTWWFGAVLGASLVAGLAGAAIAPRLRRYVREEWLLAAAAAVVAIVAIAVAWGPVSGNAVLLVAALMAAAVGVGASAGKMAFDAIVQRDAPDAARGRAFARFEALFQVLWVIGALIPVVVTMPLRLGFGAIAVVSAVAAVSYPLVRRRSLVGTAGA